MKICSEPGCNNPQFGGTFCRFHQYRRKMSGGDLFVRKAKKKAVEPRSLFDSAEIPKQSKTRRKANKRYLEQIAEFWDESVADKTDFCFFCGVHMTRRDNIHHLRGRTGDYYNDKQYFVNAHNECHVYKYHMMSIDQLLKEPWYDDFLQRLKSKDIKSYQKELRKQDKNINKSLDDNEN